MRGGSGQGPQAPLTGQLDLQLWASARPTRCTGSVARPACRPAPTRSTAAPASAPSAASAQKVRASPSQDPLAEPRAGPPCPQPQAGSQDPRPQTLHWDLPQRRLCLPGPHPQGARRWRCRACHHGAAPREGVGPRGRALHDPTGGGGVPQPQPQEAPLLQPLDKLLRFICCSDLSTVTFWQSEKAFEKLPLVLYTLPVLKKFPSKQRAHSLGICYLDRKSVV